MGKVLRAQELITSCLKAVCYNLNAAVSGCTAMVHIYIIVFDSVCLADKKINAWSFYILKAFLASRMIKPFEK